MALYWSNTYADASLDKIYPNFPLDPTAVLIRNYQLYDFYPFLRLDHISDKEPDVERIKRAISCLDGIGKPLLTQMKYGCFSTPPSAYSQKDMDHPIVLIPALTTRMSIRGLPSGESNIDLLSMTVPDGKGGWKNASKTDREFYSYHRDGDWFRLKFPENKTDDFRCLAMTIAVMQKGTDARGKSVRIPTDTTRTWLFIQLPWTDNPEIFDHIPYTDFTPYRYSERRGQTNGHATANNHSTVNQKKLLIHNLSLNDSNPFIMLPDIDEENPDETEIWLGLLSNVTDGLNITTQMKYGEAANPLSTYYSSHDESHPLVLLSAKESVVDIRSLYKVWGGKDEIDLISLQLPAENGGWRDATDTEREFYSYHRDGDWFKLRFNENRTDDFRCVKLRIGMKVNHVNIYGETVKVFSGPTRTWLFIQLPWTDNPEILDKIPYTDFTPFKK